MSLKSKFFELFFFSILKWFLLLILAGVIGYLIMPKYDLLHDGSLFNKVTGRVEARE